MSDQLSSYVSYQRLGDPTWHGSATPDQLRVTAEQALGWRFGDPHLAFQVLLVHGRSCSVPALRAALARRPSDDAVSCAWEHGDQALERLSPSDARDSGDR